MYDKLKLLERMESTKWRCTDNDISHPLTVKHSH